MRITQHNFLVEKLDEVEAMITNARSELIGKDIVSCNNQLLKTIDYLEVIKSVIKIMVMAEEQIEEEMKK